MAPANQFVLPNGSSRVTGPGIENGVSLPNLPKNPLGLPINPADNLQS
jgi:hypothetical protein